MSTQQRNVKSMVGLMVYRDDENILKMRIMAHCFISEELDAVSYCPDLATLTDTTTDTFIDCFLVDGFRLNETTVLIKPCVGTPLPDNEIIQNRIRIPTEKIFSMPPNSEILNGFGVFSKRLQERRARTPIQPAVFKIAENQYLP